jgi:biphenyl-2,3-diol 1,2-dioxygenase
MSTTIIELGYLGFEVSDLARWERFATEVLGMDVHAGPGGTRALRLDEAPARFILSEGGSDDLAFVGWKVATAADVDAFAKRLDAQGLKGSDANDDELAARHASRMLHFKDPEGNRHEVYAAVPSSLPTFKSPHVTEGFVTGLGGAGHVVFEADDYPATIHFATKVLGLKLSDKVYLEPAPGIKIEVSFFHVNERHHSMAVAPRAPMPGPKKRIHHFMIEAVAMADVGRARDRCLSFGQPVVMDIGQHPNDQMISFYAHTPSGFLVEFGWGGVKVDDATWKGEAYDRISNWGHRPFGDMPGQGAAMPQPTVKAA